LAKHLENIRLHGYEPLLAFNRFPTDAAEELELVRQFAGEQGLKISFTEVHARGGAGGLELAELVLEALSTPHQLQHPYALEDSLEQKILALSTKVYGAARVGYTVDGRKALNKAENEGFGGWPIVVAKTANSLSDNKLRGRPERFTVTVTDVKPRCGAGFVVVYMGEIMTMPGLPKEPAALRIGLDKNGQTTGLF